MRTVTRYIVVLCPAAPWYLGNANSVTMMLSDARVFDTFEDAQAEGNLRRAWYAQRVEQIAVPDTRQHLDTPEARLEVRDAATCAWHECADGDPVTVRISHVEQYLRSIGLTVGVSANPGASSPVLFLLTDPNGYALTLEWDAMQDGFSYETEGEDAAAPETATCDGCENAFPVDEVEVCGSSEHGTFGFCSACRAKDAAAAVSEDACGWTPDLEQCVSIVANSDMCDTDKGYVTAFLRSVPVKPRIDMVPAKTHMVRIEGEYDAICDMLGEAVGHTIDAYEIIETGGVK